MAANIDEKVVKMEFDNAQFEKGISRTLKSLDDLKKSLNFEGATKSLDSINQQVNKLNFDSLNNAIDITSNRFSMWGEMSAAAIQRVTNKVLDLGERMVKSLTVDQIASGWNKYESVLTSTRTMMTATGASADEVGASLKKLMTFADETSYSYQQMADSMGKFAAKGFGGHEGAQAVEDARQVAEGIATWAAQAGQSASTANRVLYQMAQISGWMKKMDWSSVVNANMATKQFEQLAISVAEANGTLEKYGDVWKTTAKAAKAGSEVTIENFADTLTEGGWLTVDVFTQTMQAYNSYFDATQKVINDGLADTIYEAMDILDAGGEEIIAKYGDWTQGINKVVADAFKSGQISKTFTDSIDATKDAVSTAFTRMFQTIFGDVDQAATLWSSVTEELYNTFAAPLSDIADLFQEFGENSDFIINDSNSDLNGLNYITAGVFNTFKGLSNILANLQDAFGNLIPAPTMKTLENFSKKWLDITTSFRNSTVFKTTSDLIEEFGGHVTKVTSEVTSEVTNGAKSITGLQDDISSVINQVIRGDFKNAPDRFNLLLEAGYNYYKVQNGVNEALGNSWRYSAEQIAEVDKQLKNASTTAEATGKVMNETVDDVSTKTEEVATNFKSYYDFLYDAVDSMSISDKLHTTVVGLADGIGIIVDGVKAIWSEGINPILKAAVPRILDKVLTITAKLGVKISEIRNGLNESKPLTNAIRTVSEWLGNAYNWIKKIFDQIKESTQFKEFVNNLVSIGNFVKDIGSDVFGSIGDFFSGFNKELSDQTKDTQVTGVAISNGVFGPLNKVINFLKPAGKVVRQFFRSIRESIGDIDFSKIFEFFNNIASTVGTLFGTALRGGANVITGIVNAIKDLSGASNLFGLKLSPKWGTNLKYFLDEIKKFSFGNLTSAFSKLKNLNIAGFLSAIPMAFGKLGANRSAIRVTSLVIQDFADTASNAEEQGTGLQKIFSSIAEKLAPVFDFLGRSFSNIGKFLAPIGDAFKVLFSSVTDAWSTFDIQGLIELFGAIAALKLTFSISKLVSGFSGIGSAITGCFNSVKKFFTRGLTIKMILELAVALGIVAASLWALSKVPANDLLRVAFVLGGLMAELAGIAIVMQILNSKLGGGKFGSVLAGAGILAIASAIVLIASELEPLGKIPDDIFKSAGVRMLEIAAVLVGIQLLVTKFTSGAYTKGEALKAITQAVTLYIFANAISKVVDSLTQIAEMPIEKVRAAMPILLEIIGALGVVSWASSKVTFGSGVGLAGVVGAVWLLTKVITSITSLDLDKIKNGWKQIALVFGMIFSLAIAARIGGPNLKWLAASIVGIGIAVSCIAKSIKMLSKINDHDLGKATGAIAGIILVLALAQKLMSGATALSGNSGKQILAEFAGLGLAVVMIAAAIKMVADIDADSLRNATIAISVISVVLAGCAKLMSGSQEAKTSLIALGVVMLLMAVSLRLLADIVNKYGAQTFWTAVGGLASIFLAMASVFAGIGLAAKAGAKIVLDLIVLMLLIAEIWAVIYALNKYVGLEATKKICDSLAEVFVSLGIAMGVIGTVGALVPGPQYLAGLMESLVTVAAIFGTISGIAAAFHGAIAAFNYFAGSNFTAKDALNGVSEALDVFVIIFKKIGEALGSLVGGAVGGFEASKAEAIANADVDGLSNIATKLSDFLENIKDILDPVVITRLDSLTDVFGKFSDALEVLSSIGGNDSDLKKLKEDIPSYVDLINDFTEQISGIGEHNTDIYAAKNVALSIKDISDVLTNQPVFGFGTTTWKNIGEGLAEYGQALYDYANSVSGIGTYTESIEQSIGIGRMLSDFLKNDVPGDPSVFGYLFTDGGKTWNNIGNGLAAYGDALKNYATSVQGIGTYETDIENSVSVGKELADLMNVLPDSPGVLEEWFSSKGPSWSTMSTGLADFGQALIDFASEVSGISGYASDLTEANLILGNFRNLFVAVGDKNLDPTAFAIFVQRIGELGNKLSDFQNATSGITMTPDDPVFAIISKLMEYAQGGTSFNEEVFDGLGTAIGNIATGISQFSLAASNYSTENAAGVFSGLTSLKNIASEFQEDGTFEALSNLGTTIVQTVADAIYGDDIGMNVGGGQIASALRNAVMAAAESASIDETSLQYLYETGRALIGSSSISETGLIGGINAASTYIAAAVTNATKKGAGGEANVGAGVSNGTGVFGAISTYFNAGKQLIGTSATSTTGVIGGVLAEAANLVAAAKSVASSAAGTSGVRASYLSWKESGEYLVQGLIDGFNKKASEAIAAAAALGDDMNKEFKKHTNQSSPSKLWAEYGTNLIYGLVNGFTDKEDLAVGSVRSAALEMNNAIYETISKSDSIFSDSLTPTITPVVDLKNVGSAAESIHSIFGSRSFDMAANIQNGNENRSDMEAQIKAMERNDVYVQQQQPSNTFIQNNYSPKELSRLDIYRQTKSLFSDFRGSVS